jgi:hypothetical protein
MYVLATCTASVLRGTTTNVYGDPVDGTTVASSGIPAAISESSVFVMDPSTQTPRSIRTVFATLPSTTDITSNDRLRDDTHNIVYIVESVSNPALPGRTTDLAVELRRVT